MRSYQLSRLRMQPTVDCWPMMGFEFNIVQYIASHWWYQTESANKQDAMWRLQSAADLKRTTRRRQRKDNRSLNLHHSFRGRPRLLNPRLRPAGSEGPLFFRWFQMLIFGHWLDCVLEDLGYQKWCRHFLVIFYTFLPVSNYGPNHAK